MTEKKCTICGSYTDEDECREYNGEWYCWFCWLREGQKLLHTFKRETNYHRSKNDKK